MSVQDFVAVTGASIATAETYLAQNGGDLQRALGAYRSQRAARSRGRGAGGVTSLRDLHNREADNDPHNLFTGGERSGLEVEGPGGSGGSDGRGGPAGSASGPDVVGRIIDQARNAPPNMDDFSDEEGDDVSSRFNFTSAAGFRLGTSQDPVGPAVGVASAPAATSDRTPQRVKRTIYFWQNGFSVDDGELYRYDDPQNVRYLEAINSGNAPLEVLGVVSNQYVDVRVEQRTNEPYVQPKRLPSFNSSEGQRLGTMGPSVRASASPEAALSPALASGSSERAASAGPGGDTTVQVRLADGTQHRAQFDGQGTVQQLYDYAEGLNGGREFVMSTMFPMRRLEDRSETLKGAGLANSVVVQRYT